MSRVDFLGELLERSDKQDQNTRSVVLGIRQNRLLGLIYQSTLEESLGQPATDATVF